MNYGLPYKGSKNTIAEDIVKCIPRGVKILDACCGGGAFLMAAAMSGRWKFVVGNDRNRATVDLLDAVLINKGQIEYNNPEVCTRDDFFNSLQRIKEGAYDLKDEAETMTLGEAAVKFEQYERAKGVKPGSIDAFVRGLKSLESLFDRPVASISAKELNEAFMDNTSGNSSRTYMNKKTIVSTFFNYVVDVLEILPKNPIKKAIPKRKVKKAHREFWTTEQIDRIIANAPSPSTRLLWSFMAFAGLRASEAKAMRPEKIYGGKIHVVGKGDKPATIPVCPRLQREIDRYDGEWNFKASQYTLEKAARKALPEGFQGNAHPHRFRHSFGSNLIRAGVNVKIVQTLMRHENISLTLDTYGHILDTDSEKAISDVYK